MSGFWLLTLLYAVILLCAVILLRVEKVLAFSLQDYEGGVRLGEWRGSLEGAYWFEDDESSAPGSSFNMTTNRFDELMKIRNDGFYLLDPRVVTGDAGLDLDLYQEQNRFSQGPGVYRDGLLWGYNADITLFSQLPETATLFANQHQAVSNTAYGGRTENNASNFGLMAQLMEDSFLKNHGLYYFTSRVSVAQEQFDEKTSQLGETYRLDQTRDVVDYDAHKGFQTADLDFRYDFTNERDSGTSNQTLQKQNFALDYSKDFGPNLNRHWDSDIFYYSLTGSTGQMQNLFVNEMVRIQHLQTLVSSYQYELQYNDVANLGTATYQFVQAALQHTLYRNMSEYLTLGGTYQTLPHGQGNISNYWIGASTNYTHELPWHGSFFLTTDGQYQIQNNNLSSSQIAVTDEPHTAPLTDAPFTLNNNFVIDATIVVLDARGGSRLPTTRNIDYIVLQFGNQTQIKRVPTSLVIQPGDPLLVSYSYQVAANARFSTITKDISLGVRFPLIDASYAYQTVDQSLLSGSAASQLLEHLQSNTFSVGVHYGWESIATRANAIYQTVDSNSIAFDLTDFSQNVTYHPGWSVALALTGDEAFTDYSLPKERTKSYSLEFDGDRPFARGGDASLIGSLRRLQETGFPT